MPNQSNILETGEFAPIKLSPDFPVSDIDRNLRGEEAPIAPHVHDCFELGYCYEGSGIFLVENKILSFQAGDAVVVNHRELHLMHGKQGSLTKWDFINLKPTEMLAKYVSDEERFLNTEKFCGVSFQNILSGSKHPEICRTIRNIIKELTHKEKGYRSVVRSLVWMLLVKLHRLVPEQKPDQTFSRHKLERIQPAIIYIAANYQNSLSIEDLAKRCHTSVANFRKLFHAAVGMSPIDYIKKLRLKVAAVMLTTTNHPINEIALESGYPTLSNFNRHFQSHYNQSPRQYRNGQLTVDS